MVFAAIFLPSRAVCRLVHNGGSNLTHDGGRIFTCQHGPCVAQTFGVGAVGGTKWQQSLQQKAPDRSGIAVAVHANPFFGFVFEVGTLFSAFLAMKYSFHRAVNALAGEPPASIKQI